MQTAAMHLTSGTESAAFKKDNNYTYILWAKALTDKSETANATYSFPANFEMNAVYRYEWNYSLSDTTSRQSFLQIAFNGSPAIFSSESLNKLLTNQTITFPVSTRTLGVAPFIIS